MSLEGADVGRIVAGSAALSHPEKFARWLTPPLVGFAWFVSPFTALLNSSANLVLRVFGEKPASDEERVPRVGLCQRFTTRCPARSTSYTTYPTW